MTHYEQTEGQLFTNQVIAKRVVDYSFRHEITGYQQKFMEECICRMLSDKVAASLQMLNQTLVLSLHGDNE